MLVNQEKPTFSLSNRLFHRINLLSRSPAEMLRLLSGRVDRAFASLKDPLRNNLASPIHLPTMSATARITQRIKDGHRANRRTRKSI